MNSKSSKVVSVISKFLEIACFVTALLYATFFVLNFALPSFTDKILRLFASETDGELNVNGFDILALKDGVITRSAVVAFSLAGLFSMLCKTMIFRNLYLIIKTSAGKTWFSKGETPFQKDISRMVKEIGIFYIMIPVLETVISAIFRPIIGMETAEISVRMEGLLTGLIIIVLSSIFVYGEKLENEVEGLV